MTVHAAALSCPCGANDFRLIHTYRARPPGETAGDSEVAKLRNRREAIVYRERSDSFSMCDGQDICNHNESTHTLLSHQSQRALELLRAADRYHL